MPSKGKKENSSSSWFSIKEWKRNSRSKKVERFAHFSKSEKEKSRSSHFPSKSKKWIIDMKKERFVHLQSVDLGRKGKGRDKKT